jgi:hypothetical protein
MPREPLGGADDRRHIVHCARLSRNLNAGGNGLVEAAA